MERLTVNDLNKVCYDPWELCGMDSYCAKDCHEEGGCTKGCHILKMYRKLAEYEDLEEHGQVIKLPYKISIGDKFYIPNEHDNSIIIRKIEQIRISKNQTIFIDNLGKEYAADDFNNRIFRARRSATLKLEELRKRGEINVT